MSPISLSSSGFIYFTSPVYTNCFPFNLSAFQFMHCSVCVLFLWELKRGDDEASKLQTSLFVFRLSKLSLSLCIYCTVYVYRSVKCVFTTLCCFSSAYMLLPPFFHPFEIICCIPTEQMMEISFLSTDSQ